jgi:hypothetical protein
MTFGKLSLPTMEKLNREETTVKVQCVDGAFPVQKQVTSKDLTQWAYKIEESSDCVSRNGSQL